MYLLSGFFFLNFYYYFSGAVVGVRGAAAENRVTATLVMEDDFLFICGYGMSPLKNGCRG